MVVTRSNRNNIYKFMRGVLAKINNKYNTKKFIIEKIDIFTFDEAVEEGYKNYGNRKEPGLVGITQIVTCFQINEKNQKEWESIKECIKNSIYKNVACDGLIITKVFIENMSADDSSKYCIRVEFSDHYFSGDPKAVY